MLLGIVIMTIFWVSPKALILIFLVVYSFMNIFLNISSPLTLAVR